MSCFRVAALIVIWACWGATSTSAGELQLTHDGRQKQDPVFLGDGETLVYTVLETPVQMSLMRLRLSGGKPERLHPSASTNEFEPAFSADNRYAAFVQSRSNLNLVLVIEDLVAGTQAVYDQGSGFQGMHHPTIAPDGSRIVFSTPAVGGQQIVSVDPQGRDRRELTTDASINSWPEYSPDGRTIAFGSSRDGDFDLYLMDADGGRPRRLLARPGRDVRPRWSPDGRRIVFTGQADGNDELFVVDADGGDLRRLTNNAERDDFAAWHPDGRRIVYLAERRGRFDLFLIDVSPTANKPARP